MGNDEATPPQRYGTVRGVPAPLPAPPPSKWRPFITSVIFCSIWLKFGSVADLRMGNNDATPPQCYGAVGGVLAPFPAPPPLKWRPFNNSVIFRSIWLKFGPVTDLRMGNDDATPPQCYGAVRGVPAPFPPPPPSKWRPLNNSIIFRSIWLKFNPVADLRIGNDDITPPQRYGAVGGVPAPFLAPPPSKWRPFNNSVIFRSIWLKFGPVTDLRMGNDDATPPQCYGAVRGVPAPFPPPPPSKWRPLNNSIIFRSIWLKFNPVADLRIGNDDITPPQRYGAIGGVPAPFLAPPPSKWHPFNNSVIFRSI